MKILCTVLIVIVGLASPLSVLAAAVNPCSQLEAPAGDHHGAMNETTSHHGGSNSDVAEINCDCCSNCISLCGSSVNSCIASTPQSLAIKKTADRSMPSTRHRYDDLNRNSLFRPPKPNA